MLAIVENEHELLLPEVRDERIERRAVRRFLNSEGSGSGAGDQRSVCNRGQLDKIHERAGVGTESVADSQRDPRLTDAARSGHRDQAVAGEHSDEIGDLALPADQRRPG